MEIEKKLHDHDIIIKGMQGCIEVNTRDIHELKQSHSVIVDMMHEQNKILYLLDQRINKNGLAESVKQNAKDMKSLSKQLWIVIAIMALVIGEKVFDYIKIFL
jgi:hypothetical protein